MEDWETIQAACKEIKRWAPTQSHAVRRAMMDIANFWSTGFDIDKDVVIGGDNYGKNMFIISSPLNHGGEFIGHAEMTVTSDGDGNPIVTAEFKPAETTDV